MQRQYSSLHIAGWWCFVVAAIAACGVVFGGGAATNGSVALFAIVMLVPAAVMMALWRGAPSPAVSELLYASDRVQDDRP